jgi:type I restriction enzyme, S subunit
MVFAKIADLISERISGEWGEEPNNGRAVRVLRTTNFTNNGNLKLDSVVERAIDDKIIEKKKLRFGDTIIEKSGGGPSQPVGRVVFFNLEDGQTYLCNNFTAILRPCDNVLPKFFFYSLFYKHLKKNTLRYQNKTTGIINLQLERYLQEEILLPPLPIQKKIAVILEKADATREKRQQANLLTEQFLQSAFLEMFGDPVTNPRGWDVAKLGEIGSLERGRSKHRPRNAPFLLGGPYPLIQTGEIANSMGYITNYTQTYSELGLKQSKMWKKGTLCITIAANIGKTAILTFDACFPDSIVGFNPNGRVKTEFIQRWFTFVQKKLEDSAPMVAQKNISLEILRKQDVPVPPIDLQQEFVTLVKKVELLRAKQKESEKELENLFQSLMQRAFKGELVKMPVATTVQQSFGLSTTDVHVGLLGKIIMAHEDHPKHKATLGHVKGEKICHIVENHMNLDLGRNPKRMAAGPVDYKHLLLVESRASKTNRFMTISRGGAEGKKYVVRHNLQPFLKEFDVKIEKIGTEIDHIINLFVPMDTERAEVVATIYAAWNDLLLDGKNPTDEEIVKEARENWTPEKLLIEPEKFFKSISWLKRNDLVPKGYGKHTIMKQ